MPRLTYRSGLTAFIQSLNPRERESLRRIEQTLRLYPELGLFHHADAEGAWYALWGVGLYVVYRHRQRRIEIANIARWAGPPEEG